jgi:hypothetical protein
MAGYLDRLAHSAARAAGVAAMGRKPDFLIIGAMKSATSSLYHQLRRQPGVYMPDLKEPNFFSDDDVFSRGARWYENLFESASPDDLCGEASTHYTKLPTYPRTLARLHEALADVRLVYVMRNPVDRLVSQYVHQWSEGEISCGIDEAIVRYPELVDYSRYAFQIAPYVETFGRGAVLPVFFENLKADSQVELERICRFLGYRGSPEWQPDLKPDNVSSKRVRRFPLYGLLVDLQLAVRLRRMLVPKPVRTFIRRQFTMGERPRLSAESLAVLDAKFSEDLSRLSGLFGCGSLPDRGGVGVRYDWIRKAVPADAFDAMAGEDVEPKGNRHEV